MRSNRKQSENEPRDDHEIRVTDRRRIYLDQQGNTASGGVSDAPNLKPTYVEELETRTRAAEAKVQEVQSRFEQLRSQLQRETDETRQRLNRAADERARGEKANFITALLPVLDDLERAAAASAQGEPSDQVAAGIRKIADSFVNALLAAGVEPIDSVGEPFDPELHEAIETNPVAAAQDGTVLVQHSRGYRFGNRLLRPARVTVGRSAERSDSASK